MLDNQARCWMIYADTPIKGLPCVQAPEKVSIFAYFIEMGIEI
jgi:hypothetical protein